LKLVPTTPPADDTAPTWLHGDDTSRVPPLLDDSWLNPAARNRPADDANVAPDWLRRDELKPSLAPAPAGSTALPNRPEGAAALPDRPQAAPVTAEQRSDELPDWLREIADESRQRLEARTPDAAPATEQTQPAAQPSLANSADLPDWLREIAQANAADDANASEGNPTPPADIVVPATDDTPPWLRDEAPASEDSEVPAQTEPAAGEVVDAELVAVEVESRSDAADADSGAANIPPLPDDDATWRLGGAAAEAPPPAEEAHARVYDIPADSIWSVQPDRPAADGSTGQQTPVWAVPDQTATTIVPQPAAFELPSWLVDDDIEPTSEPAPRAWSPPSWLEDSDVDGPPAQQPSASWTPPSWLDDDDDAASSGFDSRAASWLDDDGGGVAVASDTTVKAMIARPAPRPVEGQSAELLQRLLSEPASAAGPTALPGRPEPAVAAVPNGGGSTMLVVIVVVLLVMAALVAVFAAPAVGFNLF